MKKNRKMLLKVGHSKKPLNRPQSESYNLPIKEHYKLKLHIKFQIIK